MTRWLAVVLLLVSGCAFGLSAPDPDAPRSQMPKCDTGKGLVALDGAVAAASGVIALSLAGDSEPAVALLPLSIGAIYAAGAIRGNSNVNKCRRAMGEYESYMAARDTMPRDTSPRGMAPRDMSPADIADRPVEPPSRAPIGAPAQPPGMAAPPAPVAAAPAPPVQAQPQSAPQQAKGAKQAPPPKQEQDWFDFWREVE